MKRLVLTIVCLAALVGSAAPFVTPGMIKRNGLTDEQYALLWAQGKNPRIEQAAARDWIFRSARFTNVTNWLDICGTTNNFAALSFDLQDKNFKLTATNLVLVATNRQLTATCERLANAVYDEYVALTNQMAQTTAYSNLYVIVSAQAQAATAKIADEIADLQAKIETYKEYQTKYPLLKAIFAAMITDAQNRIKILQALTGTNQ